MLPEISIIIPAYNAEAYLEVCIASVKAQTLTTFEAIIVNDASTDSTPELARRITEGDDRFRVIDLPQNRGLSGARNAGTAEASGEYVTYLDSDDALYPQALEAMLGLLREHGAEVCCAAFSRSGEFTPRSYGRFRCREFDYEGAMKATLYRHLRLNSAWAKLYRKERIVSAGGFREGIWYEDLDSFYRIMEGAGKILYIEEPLYFYRDHAGSFVNRWSEGRLDVLDVTDRMAEFFAERYPELHGAALDRRFSAHFNILMLLLKNGVRNPEAEARCMAVIKEGRSRALRDRAVKLKNKIGAVVSLLGRPALGILSRIFY